MDFARCGNHLLDAHYSNTITETLAIRCIPVSQQIAQGGVPGKGFGDLTSEPSLHWTLGDLEVNDPSSMVIKDNHSIKEPKCRVRNHEQGMCPPLKDGRPMSACGVRRAKAALSSGCKAHPATAPAGSNRSSHGGDEVAEAFGVAGHVQVTARVCGPQRE